MYRVVFQRNTKDNPLARGKHYRKPLARFRVIECFSTVCTNRMVLPQLPNNTASIILSEPVPVGSFINPTRVLKKELEMKLICATILMAYMMGLSHSAIASDDALIITIKDGGANAEQVTPAKDVVFTGGATADTDKQSGTLSDGTQVELVDKVQKPCPSESK
jgi:hypothetical protein